MNLDDAVDLTLKNILAYGCSDITTEFIEIKLIREFRDEFAKDVKAQLKKGSIQEMEFKPLQYLLTPKNRFVFDYRKAAIINPSCLAKYSALVFQFADIIEEHRIPVSKSIVFSYRFKPVNDDIFDKNINYSTWKEKTKELADSIECNYVVSCDISAFYDRINIHRLESTLQSIGVDRRLVKLTNDLLLFWSKKDSYGLPVGSVASRILAEAALIDIDQFLLSENINYTRYVDDFRLFAPDLLTAQKWMNMLTNRLFRDGLMLNTAKTEIRKAVPNEKLNSEESKENESESAETVLKVITKLTGGYNRIVRRFIMPAVEKQNEFLSINIGGELKLIEEQIIVEFSGIQKITVAALVQKDFGKLVEIAEVCSKYVYGLDYFIDMLLKNHEFIPLNERNKIADFYERIILDSKYYSLEWYCASIAKLLSHSSYFRKKALIYLIKSPGKDVSTYPSMIALEGLCDNITRSEFRTIREWFERSDEWEKRRLVWLSRALPDDERKAWTKAIKVTVSDDILCHEYSESIIKGKAI